MPDTRTGLDERASPALALPIAASSTTPACSRPRTPVPLETLALGLEERRAAEVAQWAHVLDHYASQALVLHPVPHFKQLFSWDCGLACAVMALKAIGLHHCNYTQVRQLCPTTSIWTIDLAHLLRRFGLEVTFFTITLGPNPAFYNESFYLAHMQEDERRVTQLFHDASAAGIYLAQRSVCWQELAVHLVAGHALVIVLVDKRKLDPWLMAADMCLPYALCGMDLGYTGHYILLVGWDAHAGQFLIRDPSSSGASEARVTPAALDAARSAFGTDEDVLLVRHAALSHNIIQMPHTPHTPIQPAGSPTPSLSPQPHQPMLELCPPMPPTSTMTAAQYLFCPVQLSQLYACQLGPQTAYGLGSNTQLWAHPHCHPGGSQGGAGLGEVRPAHMTVLSMQQQWHAVSGSRVGSIGNVASAGLSRPELLLQPPEETNQTCMWWYTSGGGRQTTSAHGAHTSHQQQQQWHSVSDGGDRGGGQQQEDAHVSLDCGEGGEGGQQGARESEAVAGKPGAMGTEEGNKLQAGNTGVSTSPASSWASFWYWAPCWSGQQPQQQQQQQLHQQQQGSASSGQTSSASSGGGSSATSTCSEEMGSTCDSQPDQE